MENHQLTQLGSNTFKKIIDTANVVSIAFRGNRFSEFGNKEKNNLKPQKTLNKLYHISFLSYLDLF